MASHSFRGGEWAPLAGLCRPPTRPDREGGRAKMVLNSCFWARTGFAASRFPACPVSTERILASRQSVSPSCTVLSVRSTIFAMMPVATPPETYMVASAFIPTST